MKMRKTGVIGVAFLTVILGVLLFVVMDSCSGPKTPNKSSNSLLSSDYLPVSNHSLQEINVYLENSGSMDGYVKGNTGFEQSLFAYLSEMQINNIVDTLNLNYINSRVIPLGHDVEKFIHHIEPVDFRRHGGNLGTTDIAIVLDTIFNRHKSNEISMFVSDCIISPGSKYASNPNDLDNYLIEQRTRIKKSVVQLIDKNEKDLAIVICQLTSFFDGKFYNKVASQVYEGNRPFYLWLIGSTTHIKHLLEKIPLEILAGNGAELENVYTSFVSPCNVDYQVLLSPKIGSYMPDRGNPKRAICKVQRESKGHQKGMFMFSFGANLSQLPLAEDYILDISNYELSNRNYSLSIKEQNSAQFSHVFSLTSKGLPFGRVSVTLKNRFPKWVEERTDSLGNNLVEDSAMDKTYGLKYLIEGIYEAIKSRQSEYAKFEITINN